MHSYIDTKKAGVRLATRPDFEASAFALSDRTSNIEASLIWIHTLHLTIHRATHIRTDGM